MHNSQRARFRLESRRTALKTESNKPAWVLQAEDYIRALEGIEDVAIVWDNRSICEIHVVSGSLRPPRLVARDVESVLKARGIKVDFKTISVAQVRIKTPEMNGSGQAPYQNGSSHAMDPDPVESFLGPIGNGSADPNGAGMDHGSGNGVAVPYTESQGGNLPQILRLEPEERGPRLKFVSVNVLTVGRKAQAQVELACGVAQVMGAAGGTNTRLGAPRLVVAATLDAVKQLLADDVEFALEAIDFVDLGGQRLVLVAVACLEERRQRALYGTAAVEGEPNQAVVSATLDALNRPFGRFQQKERIEYELRPTSLEV